ncbi:MAG: tRNA (adenosine(37)-N6)-dimethylallyltransferase MiaA [Muribaculaceae bacterium]|nr:tRNA (adenosine(37)-N6)-dimethylallyltransferase MiaA [Muribaculaceae bacterium]
MAIETIAVIGPTASGKTRRAVTLASGLNGEIISADSRQVYKDMTLGTGKDLDEYGDIPFHLIDICEAGEKYNLHRFLSDFSVSYNDILSRGKLPVVCGGSGMYVENALNGNRMPEVPCNEELRNNLEGKNLSELTEILKRYKTLHNTTDVDTVKRAIRAIEISEYYRLHPKEAELTKSVEDRKLNSLVIGISIPREARRERISQRLKARLEDGMVEEVENLLKRGIPPQDLIYYGLEYKFLTLHLIGELSYDEMFTSLETAIHQFAKRQMTWFRGMEKRGTHINWLPYDISDEDFLGRVKELYK